MSRHNQVEVGNWYDDQEDYYAIIPGVDRLAFTGEKVTCTLNVIKAKLPEPPQHNHVHEQFGIVIQGDGDFIVDGKHYTVEPGFFVYFPSNLPHGFSSAEASRTTWNLEVFAPARLEYLKDTYLDLIVRGQDPMKVMITE